MNTSQTSQQFPANYVLCTFTDYSVYFLVCIEGEEPRVVHGSELEFEKFPYKDGWEVSVFFHVKEKEYYVYLDVFCNVAGTSIYLQAKGCYNTCKNLVEQIRLKIR